MNCRWKLLDFAELKRSSISFFEIEKHESAISRWSRARTRAAKVDLLSWTSLLSFIFYFKTKAFHHFNESISSCLQVGKGLSKNNKARKLALQHWLEAVS